MNDIYSVGRLNEYVNDLLSSDVVTKLVKVKGEISGFKKYPSGHAYFQIKDEEASVRCVLFKGNFSKLSIRPEEGMQVIVTARAGLYVQDGRFQLVIYDMQNDGIGALYRKYEQLKEELKIKGLFDIENKKKIPFMPRRIGIITSPKGAVISDIIHVLKRRFSGFNALIYPVSVQGATSSEEIINAIKWFNFQKNVDVIIIARGGGSIEDLWSFNDKMLAHTIFDSLIPVISAVGHETDFTIADFVSDLRAPTPSAAAELVLPEKKGLYVQLYHYQTSLYNSIHTYLDSKRSNLNMLKMHRAMSGPNTYINEQAQRLDYIHLRLQKSVSAYIQKQTSIYSILDNKLKTLSPFSILDRGYAWVTGKDEEIIYSTKHVRVKDQLRVHLKDGAIHTTVDGIEQEVTNNEG